MAIEALEISQFRSKRENDDSLHSMSSAHPGVAAEDRTVYPVEERAGKDELFPTSEEEERRAKERALARVRELEEESKRRRPGRE